MGSCGKDLVQYLVETSFKSKLLISCFWFSWRITHGKLLQYFLPVEYFLAKSLLRSSLIFSFFTFISRILGLLREMIFANVFGASLMMDAFLVAFKIPNFLRRLFAEGAFSQAFVPVLSEVKEQGTVQEYQDLIAHVLGALMFFLILLLCLLEASTGFWIHLFAPGFSRDPQKYALAVSLLHITFPYLLLVCYLSFAASLYQVRQHFGLPSSLPIILNLCFIAMVLYGAPYFSLPVFAAAWSLIIAGVLQSLVVFVFGRKSGLWVWPRLSLHHPGVHRLWCLMAPALLGASMVQISLLIDTFFASWLQNGRISWLYYADRLMQFPLGVIGVALGTVVLPSLSRAVAQKRDDLYQAHCDWGLRVVLSFGIPAAIGLIFLAKPLELILYYHGAFSLADLHGSSEALIAFAMGLWAFMAIKVLVSAFYARYEMKLPVKIAGIAIVCNIVLNALLISSLKHIGIALATSLAAMLNVALLAFYLQRRNYFVFKKQWFRYIAVIGLASLAMIAYLYFGGYAFSLWLAWSLKQRLLHLALQVLLAMATYFGVCYLLGFRRAFYRGA